MTDDQRYANLIDRLHANLRAAGIPATEADIEGVVAKGFLDTVLSFEELAVRALADDAPDYLAPWGGGETLTRAESPPVGPVAPARGGPDGELGELEHAPITRVAQLLHAREVSPVELALRCLGRIEARDSELNAFQLVLAEDALATARDAEREILAGEHRGPLHGVPVAVKDLLAMAGVPTTAGSRVFGEWAPEHDAASVERLRDAGAVIVGKTRLSELAYSPGSNNAHYGPTRNPWNPAHDAGGSSSGSAAAVAAGMAYAALGTDTGGSIRIPSALCGLVGLKPTYGRASLFGGVSLSWSLDHLGPIARTVEDAALLLAALAGPDARDPRTRPGTEYSADPGELERGVAGLRVGVLRDDGTDMELGAPEAVAAWRAGLGALEREGASLVELPLPELAGLRAVASVILVLEAAAYHEARLRERPHLFGEFARHRLLFAYALGPTALVRAQQLRASLRRRASRIWDTVDLLSTPSMPDGAPPLGVPASTRYTAPFNALGWPAVTVPTGLTPERLPLGTQLIGPPWGESLLLRAARAVERSGPWARVSTTKNTESTEKGC